MKPTLTFRQVWRTLSDGNGELRVLSLQQWYEAEGWEHPDYLAQNGSWEDVEISHAESPEGPQ